MSELKTDFDQGRLVDSRNVKSELQSQIILGNGLNDHSQINQFREAIKAAKLAMYDNTRDKFILIPASLKPLIIPDQIWIELVTESRAILTAIEKTAIWLRKSEQVVLAESLFSDLSDIEREVAFGHHAQSQGLATARLDLFFNEENLFVIEVNTTIPAMQAYSDMIRESYLSSSKDVYHLKNMKSQSNVGDLLNSLLEHYEKSGGKEPFPRIAIVARRGDSQLAELLWLRKKWQELGHEVLISSPDQVEIKGQSLHYDSKPVDLTYRHIFANRLEKSSAFAQACLQSPTYRIFNPISAHLEAKGVLAKLSEIAADDNLSKSAELTPVEREVVLKRIPWSRIVLNDSSLTPEGTFTINLISWLKKSKNEVVIKSSLGYGGKSVVVGENFHERSTLSRVQKFMGVTHEATWEEFIDYCASQKGGIWIAQKKIGGKSIQNKFISADRVVEEETFIDCSIFSNSGVTYLPKGGACRFSSNIIVNLGQGGGLIPLFLKSEVEALSVAGN